MPEKLTKVLRIGLTADRKFSACTQTDLLDVSIWVTTQRRGSVDMIDTTVKSRDVKKEWHTSLKEIGIFLGGSLIMQTVIGGLWIHILVVLSHIKKHKETLCVGEVT